MAEYEWKCPQSLSKKKNFKSQLSARRLVLAVFWDWAQYWNVIRRGAQH
jgi:hypothetical protein